MFEQKVNLFVVGAAKAGTSSLASIFENHPEISVSAVKEPNYFSEITKNKKKLGFFNRISDLDEYRHLFEFNEAKKYYVDSSTSYLFDENAASKIYDYNPDAKIIIIVREPMSRAFSHYLNDFREGHINNSFEYYVNSELSSSKKIDKWGDDFGYLQLGDYKNQVLRYKKRFNKNLLILQQEDLKNITLSDSKLSNFLSLDFSKIENNTKNQFSMPKSRIHQIILSSGYFRLFARYLIPAKYRKNIHTNMLKKANKPIMNELIAEKINNYYKGSYEEFLNEFVRNK